MKLRTVGKLGVVLSDQRKKLRDSLIKHKS